MGVVVDVVGLDHRLELDRRLGEAAGPVVGAAERLAHRGLLRRPPRRLGQRLGGVDEVAVFEQLDPAPVQRVGGLGLSLRRHRTSVGGRPSRLFQPALPSRSSKKTSRAPSSSRESRCGARR